MYPYKAKRTKQLGKLLSFLYAPKAKKRRD
jgi:hypothetical protein